MARPRAEANAQTSVFEKVVEDPALEKLLDERSTIAESRAALNKQFEAKKDAIEAALAKHELGLEAPIRVGGWVVELKRTPERQTSFEVPAGSRVAIRKAKD